MPKEKFRFFGARPKRPIQRSQEISDCRLSLRLKLWRTGAQTWDPLFESWLVPRPCIGVAKVCLGGIEDGTSDVACRA
jgi:hypothetical protein